MQITKIVIGTALIVTLSTSTLLLPIGAAETDLQKRQELLQKEIQQTENLLSLKKKEESKALLELRQLNSVLSSTEKQLKTTEKKLTTTEKELSQLEKELKQVETDLSVNTELLQERLRAMYVEGDVHILEVLLDSASITDFLTRWDLFSLVAENDSQLIDGIKQNLAKHQEQKKIAESKKISLGSLKEDQDVKKHEIAIASSRQRVVLQQVQSEKASVEKALDDLEEENNKIAAEIRKLTDGDDTAYMGSGVMAWPAPGYSRITSPYGWRRHPILKTNRLHTGMDIGAPMSSRVIAADNGKVIESGWRGGYGRVVMINHGGNTVTLYAHLSASLVNVGDVVKKGEQIAKVGSTGWSTGPHLHFEVRKNGDTVNPASHVKYK